MHYKNIETNGNNQVLKCLVCNNEDFENNDVYCKICGTPIINQCSNQSTFTDRNCGIVLPANARYCTICGSKSTFFLKGLLQTWEDEKNGIQFSPKTHTETTVKQVNSLQPPCDPELPF